MKFFQDAAETSSSSSPDHKSLETRCKDVGKQKLDSLASGELHFSRQKYLAHEGLAMKLVSIVCKNMRRIFTFRCLDNASPILPEEKGQLLQLLICIMNVKNFGFQHLLRFTYSDLSI